MGFPVGYSELPTFLLHLFIFLTHLREMINFVFRTLGLSSLLDSEAHVREPTDDSANGNHRRHNLQELCSVAAELIRGSMPAVQFRDLIVAEGVSDEGRDLPETCTVCLCEFEGYHEVRRMRSCRHVFHRWCVDRWLEHGQRTCPLCRAEVVVVDDGATAPERLVDGESPSSLMHAAAPSGWNSSNPFLLAAMES